MISSSMYVSGVSVVGNWRTLRVAEDAAQSAAANSHHAIPLPKRRTAAETVASVNRGLT
jgi:hypothetical protein